MQNLPSKFAMSKFRFSIVITTIFLLICAIIFSIIGIANAVDSQQNSDTAMQETQAPPDENLNPQENENSDIDKNEKSDLSTDFDNSTTNTEPIENVTIPQNDEAEIIVEDYTNTILETYIVTEGANQNFNPNDPDDLEFVVNAPVTKFSKVEIDGNELTEIIDYDVEAEEGGTEIEVGELYLLNLGSIGSHEIVITFTDGSASTNFTNYKEYNFIKGEDLEIDLEKEENAIFEVDCEYSKFANKVTIEGEELNTSCYTTREGSTIVELYYDYLKTLEDDEDYDIRIYFDDGIAETEFEIDELDDGDENIDDEILTDPAKLGGAATKTSDDLSSSLIFGSLALAGLCLFLTIIYRKKTE